MRPLQFLRAADREGESELAAFRRLFVSYCIAVAAVMAVAIVLGNDPAETEGTGIAIVSVVAIGAVSLVAGRLVRRHLDDSSDAALLTSYRTRLFPLRVACAEAPALVGFVIAVSLGPWWVSLVGLVFAVVGLARVAPTTRNLQRDDNELHARGCHRSISRVLTSTSTTR